MRIISYFLAFSTRSEYGISQTYILIISTPAIIWFIKLNLLSIFCAVTRVKRDTFFPRYTEKVKDKKKNNCKTIKTDINYRNDKLIWLINLYILFVNY